MRQLNMSVTNGELVSPSAGAGFVEEVNATRLAITLSGELAEADIDYYLLNAVPCDADGSTYGDRQLSERIYASGEAEPGYVSEEVLYFNLVPSLTLHRRMKLQLEAHRLAADGTIASVVKSSVAVICFGESVVGESNAFSAQMRGLIADFRREVAAASNIIAQTRVMLGGMSIDRLDDALTAFETARDTAIAAFETAADSSIEAFEDHTHNNISSLAKLQENSSGKPMYAADMLGTFSLAENANALPASPGVGDLCYVSSNLLPCESLTLQTGTEYSKLYFNSSPVLPEAAFDITLTRGSNEVNICYSFKRMLITARLLGVITQKVDDNNIFGDGTFSAVLAVQRLGRIEENGIADSKTVKALGELIDAKIKKLGISGAEVSV